MIVFLCYVLLLTNFSTIHSEVLNDDICDIEQETLIDRSAVEDLRVHGDAKFYGDAKFKKDVEIQEDLKVKGETETGSLIVDCGASIGCDLVVDHDLSVGNTIYAKT